MAPILLPIVWSEDLKKQKTSYEEIKAQVE